MTNCSKAAKPLAFDGEMDADADADADGGDDGDGDVDVDAALEANVPCCNSPKREQRGTTTGVHIINRDLYLTVIGKGYASLTSGAAADVVVTNADNLRMLREDELLSRTTANLLLSMLRCRCAATR